MAADGLKFTAGVKSITLKPPKLDASTGALGRSQSQVTLLAELQPEDHAELARLVSGAAHEVQVVLRPVQGALPLKAAK